MNDFKFHLSKGQIGIIVLRRILLLFLAILPSSCQFDIKADYQRLSDAKAVCC